MKNRGNCAARQLPSWNQDHDRALQAATQQVTADAELIRARALEAGDKDAAAEAEAAIASALRLRGWAEGQ